MFDWRARAPLTSVGRINAPKAADVLAEELRGRIRSGEWPEGLALLTERALSIQTGLSRTSVREALRMLELDGLIEIRPGRGGGARVRRPAGAGLTRQLELFIWGRNITMEHLHDVREALEALGAHGAALRRTEADLTDLVARTEAVEAAVKDIVRYLEANLAWHMAVVRASHNELLISFMDVLSNAIHRTTESEVFDTPAVRESTLRIHRSILTAIAAKDPEAARRRMARHVRAAREVAMGRAGIQQDDAAAAKRKRRSESPRPASGSAAQKSKAKAKPRAGRRARAAKEAR